MGAPDISSPVLEPGPVPVNTSYENSGETTGSIAFPTAFKWNRNGPNGGYWDQSVVDDNIFRPFFRNIASYNLRIYNRNGFLIYESSQTDKGWDGYLENGEVAYQGVYIWKASGTFTDGTPFSKIGDVTFLH